MQSFIAGKCGPLVQRLGMDEIFADVTELIGSQLATEAANGYNSDGVPSRAAREESGEGAARPREPRPAFTGHLYAPGTGGRLLEAQTGIEISLGDTRDATMSGAGQSDDDIREHAALSPPYGGERTIPTAPVGNADHLARDRTRKDDGNAYASDVESGRCSCGCVDRLAAASAFAERVRRCLRDDVRDDDGDEEWRVLWSSVTDEILASSGRSDTGFLARCTSGLREFMLSFERRTSCRSKTSEPSGLTDFESGVATRRLEYRTLNDDKNRTL